MKESQFQSKFTDGKILVEIGLKSCPIEFKVCDTKFDQVDWKKKEPLQKIALLKASSPSGRYTKHTDNSSGNKDYDASWFVNSQSALIIRYNTAKLTGIFFPETMIRLKDEKFLTLSDADEVVKI